MLLQLELATLVEVLRNTTSFIKAGQLTYSAKLALVLCIALDKKIADIFYFDKF